IRSQGILMQLASGISSREQMIAMTCLGKGLRSDRAASHLETGKAQKPVPHRILAFLRRESHKDTFQPGSWPRKPAGALLRCLKRPPKNESAGTNRLPIPQ